MLIIALVLLNFSCAAQKRWEAENYPIFFPKQPSKTSVASNNPSGCGPNFVSYNSRVYNQEASFEYALDAILQNTCAFDVFNVSINMVFLSYQTGNPIAAEFRDIANQMKAGEVKQIQITGEKVKVSLETVDQGVQTRINFHTDVNKAMVERALK